MLRVSSELYRGQAATTAAIAVEETHESLRQINLSKTWNAKTPAFLNAVTTMMTDNFQEMYSLIPVAKVTK